MLLPSEPSLLLAYRSFRAVVSPSLWLTLLCFFRLLVYVWISDIQRRMVLNNRRHSCPGFCLAVTVALGLGTWLSLWSRVHLSHLC